MLLRYIYGIGIDDPVAMYAGSGINVNIRRFYMADPQGSVIGITDASGVLQDSHSYSAFGMPDDWGSDTTGNPLRYTGQRWDAESGLYYYRARYYSPALGRFLTTDPIGYGDGLNVYAYVGNDPVNLIDPSGLGAQAVASGVVAGYTLVSNNPHEALDALGMAPALGIGPDLLNAAIYAWQGGYANASVSVGSAVPFFGQGVTAGKYTGKAIAIGKKKSFFRGAVPGESPSLTPGPKDFKVDRDTGFVRPTHGVSVFDNPRAIPRQLTPHQVDQATIPNSLQIIQRGKNPSHFEITPSPGSNLTPQQFIDACSSISCN